jgi:small subunit ribosomal protein S4e
MSKQRHISRLAAPRSWQVARKATKWISKPLPGPRTKVEGIPLVVLLRDVEGIIENKRELKYLINTKQIIVNGKLYKETNLAVGLFDVISFPSIKKSYRIVLTKLGKLQMVEITEKEANTLLLQVNEKTSISGGKLQINLSNGWNLLTDTKTKVKVGESVLFDLKKRKITENFGFDKGATVYFVRGKRAGHSAVFKSLKESGILRRQKIAVLEFGKETIESTLNNLITIGSKKASITIN